MKKLFLLTFALLFAFASCSNMGADAGAAANPQGAKDGAVVTVGGSLSFGGAMPAKISALVENSGADGLDGIARSAFPDATSSGLTYSVYAEEDTDSATKLRYEGTVADDNSSYTVGIPVTSGKKYYVHAVAKSGGVEVFSGKSALLDFTADPSKFYANRDIALGASQTSGKKGCVQLAVNVQGAGVSSARMIYKGAGSEINVSGIKNGSVMMFNVGIKDDDEPDPANGLASGSYLFAFEFYSEAYCAGNLLYSFKESVNVFDNLVTDTWVKIGAEPWLTSSSSGTACKVTAAMVEGFGLTDIFVDPNADDDSGSGTFLHPKKTLSAALNLLRDASKDYTIYIKGELTGRQTIPENLKKTGSGGVYNYAKSLTLCGARGLDDAGVPRDSINANFSAATNNGCALFVKTTEVPITIENLKITGGYSRNFGGGIVTESDLTLGSGALVTANKSAICGGGIVIHQKTLTIMSGAEISGNSEVGNSGNSGGGGIYCYDSASVIMLGGTIKGNTANCSGGAIFLEEGSSFTMEGGVIGDASKETAANSQTNCSNYANCAFSGSGGGAIYFDGTAGGALNLYGGTIAWNYSAALGGGIYVKAGTVNISNAISYNGANQEGGGVYLYGSGANVEMTGGKINGNYGSSGGGVYNKGEFNMKGGLIANNQRDTNGKGGAVYHEGTFNIVGNSCIPPAIGNQNDFYLSNEKKIIITGALSPTSDGTASGSAVTTVAQITPYRFQENDSVLFRQNSPNPPTSMQLESGKFSLTPNGATPWYIRTNGSIYSTQYWGTKAPTDEKDVGDIVFNDGSATPYDSYVDVVSGPEKTEIIAIIALKSGSTAYGLGFYEAQKIWCDVSASGYYYYISDSASSDSGAVAMATIKALGDYNEDKYPAFWYADHYDGGGNLGSYNTGWFIPSLNEMRTMANNKTTINAAIDKAKNAYGGNNTFGGDSGGKSYWTASQYGGSSVSTDYNLVYRYIVPLSSGTSASSRYDKKDSVNVRPIHVF